MKKIIFLLTFCFLLTGCSVTYNLEINDNDIKENISVSIPNENLSKEFYGATVDETFDELYNSYTALHYNDIPPGNFAGEKPEHGLYNIKSYLTSVNGKKLEAEGNFKFSDYKYSNAVNTCYEVLAVKSTKSESSIYSSSVAKCFDNYPLLDEIQVNITTDKAVKEANADRTQENKYTWSINRSNYSNKYIKIVFAEEELSSGFDNQRKDNVGLSVPLLIVISVLFIPICIIFIYLIFKSKKSNKI